MAKPLCYELRIRREVGHLISLTSFSSPILFFILIILIKLIIFILDFYVYVYSLLYVRKTHDKSCVLLLRH